MRKLLFLLTCFLSSHVFAYWEFLSSTPDANVYYFKKKDYKSFFGGVVYAELADMKRPDVIFGEPYLSIYSKFELDCSKKKVRVLSVSYYSKNMKEGKLVTETSNKSGWFSASTRDLVMYCK